MVLSGGYSDNGGNQPIQSTMIFSLTSGVWRSGPDLPSAMGRGGSVQYDGTTFLAVHASGIYKYDVVNDVWITLPQTMKTPRRDFAYALVPSDYVQCT